jgi:hypothetical protein
MHENRELSVPARQSLASRAATRGGFRRRLFSLSSPPPSPFLLAFRDCNSRLGNIGWDLGGRADKLHGDFGGDHTGNSVFGGKPPFDLPCCGGLSHQRNKDLNTFRAVA